MMHFPLTMRCLLLAGLVLVVQGADDDDRPDGIRIWQGPSGRLFLAGEVSTELHVIDHDDPAIDPLLGFAAECEVELTWTLGSLVEAQVQVSIDDEEQASLDEATVSWRIDEAITLSAGRTESWIGWQGGDKRDRWRVNDGAWISLSPLNGVDVTGACLSAEIGDGLTIDLHVANTIFIEDDEAFERPSAKRGDDPAYGLVIDYEGAWGVGNLSLSYDQHAVEGDDGRGRDLIGVDAWAEVTALDEAIGLNLAAEVAWVSDDQFTSYGGQLSALQFLSDNLALGLNLNWLDPDDRNADDAVIEYAIALLARPTGDARFQVGIEVNRIDSDNNDDASLGLHVECIAALSP